LQDLAHREAANLLHVDGPPEPAWVARHTRAMPEYRVGHREQVVAIRSRLERHPTHALAGNASRGVGVPHCIAGGELSAETLCTELAQARPSVADESCV
jgi:oxygen-dependent protoporphyrinogen oxidase